MLQAKLIVAIFQIALLGVPTFAFFPNSYLTLGGIGGIDHRVQTEDAIKVIWADLGISDPSGTMMQAREEIQDANEHTDFSEAHDSSAHFDGERFVEGSARLADLYNGILSDMDSGSVAEARKKGGRSLHTVQDFYSHSNWVELGNTVPNAGVLGNPSDGDKLRAASDAPACSECTLDVDTVCLLACVAANGPDLLGYLACVGLCTCPTCENALISTELTSGYYYNQGNNKPPGKCAHGGPLDAETWYNPFNTNRNYFGINKDSLFCSISPNGVGFHEEAARVAVLSTVEWFRNLRVGLGDDKFKQFMGLGPSLGIAIDTTGSMESIIASVREQAIAIVDERLGTADEPSFYVLVGFNDPNIQVFPDFTSADAFKDAIRSLTASGGGDCPELSITGMRDAVNKLGSGGSLFMFTDADAKDAANADVLIAEARSKGVKIITAVFGECDAGGSAIYQRISQETLGQSFTGERAEAGTITRLTDSIGRSDSVDLLNAAGNLTDSPLRRRAVAMYEVFVDSTMTQVTFSLSAVSAYMNITKPDGNLLQPGDTGATFVSISAGALVTIVNPTTGRYIVGLDGTGSFSLAVSGISKLFFTKFTFLELSDGNHHDWVGYLSSNHTPAVGDSGTALAVLDGHVRSAQFDLRGSGGIVYQNINLTAGPGGAGERATNEYVGNFKIPTCPFVVYLTGTDSSGAIFQRLYSGLITPPGIPPNSTCDGRPNLPPTSSSTTPIYYTTRYYNHSTTKTYSGHTEPYPTYGDTSVHTYTQGGYTTICTEVERPKPVYPSCDYGTPIYGSPSPYSGYPYPDGYTPPAYTPGTTYCPPSYSDIPKYTYPSGPVYTYPPEPEYTPGYTPTPYDAPSSYEPEPYTPLHKSCSSSETPTYNYTSPTYYAPPPGEYETTSVEYEESTTSYYYTGVPTYDGVKPRAMTDETSVESKATTATQAIPPAATGGAGGALKDAVNLWVGGVAVVFGIIALL